MMLVSLFSLLALAISTCLASALPLPLPLPHILASRQSEPKNGTIRLYHDDSTSSYSLYVALNPQNYDHTFGVAALPNGPNWVDGAALLFTVSSQENSGETDYTIHSTPIELGHHIQDPLTAVYIFNAAPQFYPEGQEIFFDIAVNGQPAGQVAGGPNGVNASMFSADLNKPVNITGVFVLNPST